MGQIFSTPGVERLFDGTADTIDLRPFTTTFTEENSCNVFYCVSDSGGKHLFIFYLDVYWYLGKVVTENYLDDHNPNESIVKVKSGRKYVIYKCLYEFRAPLHHKDVEDFIKNTKVYFPIETPLITRMRGYSDNS